MFSVKQEDVIDRFADGLQVLIKSQVPMGAIAPLQVIRLADRIVTVRSVKQGRGRILLEIAGCEDELHEQGPRLRAGGAASGAGT